MRLATLTILLAATPAAPLRAEIRPAEAVAYYDFRQSTANLSPGGRPLRLEGVSWNPEKGLEFTNSLAQAQTDPTASQQIGRRLDGVQAMSAGGWFLCWRMGEQVLLGRGQPQIAPLGERMFRPSDRFVDFCLGTDPHGFFMATLHGNGIMPFVHVTLNEVPINTWSQLVAVKTADGLQRFFQNGTLVHSDVDSCWAGHVWSFRETASGPAEPLRLAMPTGGLCAEAWVFPRELSAEEIRADWLAKRSVYVPAPAGVPVGLREMDRRPAARLWPEPPTAANWPQMRQDILRRAMKMLGPPPAEKVPLDPQVHSEQDCGSYLLRKVSLAVQPGDRMPAYLLVPKGLKGCAPAIICFYGTTSGAGKETTIGRSGPEPGSPPRKNRGFAVDMVKAGFVAFAADYLRDGERVKPGQRPYDSTDFYSRFPQWSIVGKDAWDNARVVDYLQTLEFVDPERIGMVGHSYGGHSTIFAAALEPRIKAAVANGPVSEFREYGPHWAIPRREYIRSLRPYVLDPALKLPVTFYEFTALIAPKPLWVGQAVGERRPKEEENYAAVAEVYRALGHSDRVLYQWYPGDHDFPPQARKSAVEWFKRWLGKEATDEHR